MEYSHRFLLFVRFDWVSSRFGAKKGYFGAENPQFWEGTSQQLCCSELMVWPYLIIVSSSHLFSPEKESVGSSCISSKF